MSEIRTMRFGGCSVCHRPICQCVTPQRSSTPLTREQLEDLLEMAEINADRFAFPILDHDAALRLILAQQAQEIERLRVEVEKYKSLLLQSYRDNIEDFKVQCKPTCNSYGHEDD